MKICPHLAIILAVVRPCASYDGFAHHPRNDQLAKEYDQNVILLN